MLLRGRLLLTSNGSTKFICQSPLRCSNILSSRSLIYSFCAPYEADRFKLANIELKNVSESEPSSELDSLSINSVGNTDCSGCVMTDEKDDAEVDAVSDEKDDAEVDAVLDLDSSCKSIDMNRSSSSRSSCLEDPPLKNSWL